MSPQNGRGREDQRRGPEARGEVGSPRSSDEGVERRRSEGGDGSRRDRHRQLTFAFAETPKGAGAGEAASALAAKKALRHIAEGKPTKDRAAAVADEGRLMEATASAPNLARALLNVAANKGAPGADGRSVDEVLAAWRTLLPTIRAGLLDGTYEPGDVRRVWIPKPGGGRRGLGVPNVVDRWVQQAVHQTLSPIFEPTFDDSSHGFRPNRGAQTAIAEAKSHVESGYGVVVDMDISKFFDHVNHQRLIARMGRLVEDGRVLRLVDRMLKANVALPDGARIPTREGTPQGGPLSPLLSNIVLDELDRELRRRGLRFVRYADDCNVFVRTHRAGARVLESAGRFLEERLRLKLNAEKSAVRRPEETQFLGFCFRLVENGKALIELAKRSRERLAAKIRELTPRKLGTTLEAYFARSRRYLQGWIAYFGICEGERSERQLSNFDAHVRRRTRASLVRRLKTPRSYLRRLLRRGIAERTARRAAQSRRGTWSKSNCQAMTRAYPNSWFHDRMFSLVGAWRARHAPKEPPRSASGQLLLFPI